MLSILAKVKLAEKIEDIFQKKGQEVQHVLVKRHESVSLSKNYKGRTIHLEKDFIIQILQSDKVEKLCELRKAYDAIQIREEGAIGFICFIVYLHRF